mmetsp:Transcript_3218/g.4847  ORF Transcript_3218/g.4847 Transcript_3218/m.4847 type:complete len:234 (-) Transcript_3218:17-718(-)
MNAILKECSEMVATKARMQSHAVIDYLGKRPMANTDNIIGNITPATIMSNFEGTQQQFLNKMTASVQDIMLTKNPNYDSTNDIDHEATRVFQSMKTTLITAGIIETASLSILGLIATDVMGTTAATPMMAATASALAVLGVCIIPYQNHGTIRNHQSSIESLGEGLDRSLTNIGTREMHRVQHRILDGISPYTRFVHTERDRMSRLRMESEDILAQGHMLRHRIVKLMGSNSK